MKNYTTKDYQDIIERFYKELVGEISNEKEPFLLMFMLNLKAAETATDDDIVEMHGYYKGLKVAKEMLERKLYEYLEHIDCGNVSDGGYKAFINKLGLEVDNDV